MVTNCSTGTQRVWIPEVCEITSWEPPTSDYYVGQSFEQTRTNTNCLEETRQAKGTKICETPWTPDPSTYCVGVFQRLTRSVWDTANFVCKNESSENPVEGTKTTGSCVVDPFCTYGDWLPATNTVTYLESFIQTQELLTGNSSCAVNTRDAVGTKVVMVSYVLALGEVIGYTQPVGISFGTPGQSCSPGESGGSYWTGSALYSLVCVASSDSN